MKYWKGYKYVVAETFTRQTAILGYDISDDKSHLSKDGKLTVYKGYPWDGNSGPCVDTDSSMEASCVHDILCDYINLDWLPQSLQPLADQEYYNIAVEKGMWSQRAKTRVLAIRSYMLDKGAKRYSRPVFEA